MDSDAKEILLVKCSEQSVGVLAVVRRFEAGFVGGQEWRIIVGYMTGGIDLDGNGMRVWRIWRIQQFLRELVSWGGTGSKIGRGGPGPMIFCFLLDCPTYTLDATKLSQI